MLGAQCVIGVTCEEGCRHPWRGRHSVKRRGEVVLLRIGVVAGVASSYRRCVSAPERSRSCKRYRLRQACDLATGEVRWNSRFPNRGSGAYRAGWALGGGFFRPLSVRIPSVRSGSGKADGEARALGCRSHTTTTPVLAMTAPIFEAVYEYVHRPVLSGRSPA